MRGPGTDYFHPGAFGAVVAPKKRKMLTEGGGALNTFDRRGCAAGLGLQIRNFAIFMGVEF